MPRSDRPRSSERWWRSTDELLVILLILGLAAGWVAEPIVEVGERDVLPPATVSGSSAERTSETTTPEATATLMAAHDGAVAEDSLRDPSARTPKRPSLGALRPRSRERTSGPSPVLPVQAASADPAGDDDEAVSDSEGVNPRPFVPSATPTLNLPPAGPPPGTIPEASASSETVPILVLPDLAVVPSSEAPLPAAEEGGGASSEDDRGGASFVSLSLPGTSLTAFSMFNVAPGDQRVVNVTLRNDGTLPWTTTLSTVATTSSLLDRDSRQGLQMTVRLCGDGSFGGCEVVVYGPSAPIVAADVPMWNPDAGEPAQVLPGHEVYVQIVLRLPDSAGNALQAQKSVIAFIWRADESS